MSQKQVQDHRQSLVDALQSGHIREHGLRIVQLGDGVAVDLFTRNRQGFFASHRFVFTKSTMTEAELQDIMNLFTTRFVEEMVITQGVQLALPC